MVQAQKIDIGEIDAVVEEWITKCQNNRLSYSDILSFLWTRISKVEYDQKTMRSKYEEVLISALEKFNFYGQSPEYIEKVCKQNEKSASCCKVLYENEILYSCLDCKLTKNLFLGLCVECFNNSEHRFHKYKFEVCELDNAICCCGLTENSCSKHSMSEEPTDLLPKELTSRVAITIEAILRYNADVMDQEDYVPEDDCWDRDTFCTVLYNFYSDIYKKVKHVPLEGDVITHIKHLEEDGVAIYKYGSKESCENLVSKTLQLQFNASVIHAHEALRRNFAIRLLQYLEKILRYRKEFRKIFTKLLTKPLTLDECFLEKYSITPMILSAKFLFCCLKLLVSGTLREYETKKMIAKEILQMYGKLSKKGAFINSDNFDNYTNHLFSDPTLTRYLLEENLALSVFSKSIWDNSEIHDMWKLKIGEDLEKDYANQFKMFTGIRFDILILLKSGLQKWTDKLRKAFLDGLSYFLKILSKMQETNSYIRRTNQYNTGSYTRTLEMQYELGMAVFYFLQWCRDDKEVLMEAYVATMTMIQNCCSDDFNQKAKIIHFLDHSVRCLPYDSKTEFAAFCLPLTRFLAGLILSRWEKYDPTFNSFEVDTLKSIVVPLIDPILKLHVMIAQESAGLWKQNGNLLPDGIRQYRDENGRSEIFDRDIQFLQISASIMEPNTFLIHVLNKYDLIKWADKNFEENLKIIDEENVKVLICMAEHFLKLLINVMTERYIPEVGYVTKKDQDKNEVIHSLCIKSRSRSEFDRCFTSHDWFCNKIDVVDKVVNEVAVLKTPDGKLYELKETFYDQYNPFFYHYTPEEMIEAQDYQQQRRKAANQPEFIPPPLLPKLKESFSTIVHIFQSDIMLHVMQIILERTIDMNSKSYSYGQLHKVLYLICFALLDEESGHYDFLAFVNKAIKWNIFKLLDQLLTSARNDIPRGLIKWTLEKYNAITGNSTNLTNEVFEVFDKNLEMKKILAAKKRAKITEEITEKGNQFLKNNNIIDDLDESLPTIAEKTCLLCYGSQNLGLQNKPFIVLGNMSYSTVLLQGSKNTSDTIDSPLLSSKLGPAYFTSTCGHVMHSSCWEDYYEQVYEDPSMHCPLCNKFCNIVFPLFPTLDFENCELDPDLKKLTNKFANSFSKSKDENPLQMWKSLAYTVHVIETSIRNSNIPLLENLSSRNQASLEGLVGVAAAARFSCTQDESFKCHISQIALLLSGGICELGTILDFDMFGLLVVMKLSKFDLPKILHLVFLAELVKILVCTDFNEMNDENNQNCYDQHSPITQILKTVSKEVHHLSDDFIWTYVQTACVPFLRCCVLFYKFLNKTPSSLGLEGDSFSDMCSYLGLPQTREEIFGDESLFSVVKSWCSHPSVVESLENGTAVYSTAIPQLIELPNEYSELVTKISSFRDRNGIEKFGTTYKLCLVCGEIICSGSCCMKLDIDNSILPGHFCHMTECSGVGLFLSIHTCFVIAVSTLNDFISIPAPYITEYNENMATLNGRLISSSLKFSPKMYKDLHSDWLSHSILDKIYAYNQDGGEDTVIFMTIDFQNEEDVNEDRENIDRDDDSNDELNDYLNV